MSFSSTSFFSVVSCTALSGFSATATTTNIVQNSVAENPQIQQSVITIARSSLAGTALLLKIEAAADADVKGTIKVNGQLVGNLPNMRSINLANCLNQPACTIDITGTYNPSATVNIEVYSANNTMRSLLQSSGSGVLNQQLVLNIV
jgi:hypothetical protein